MPSRYCNHCKASRNMNIDVYRRQKNTPDGIAILLETKSLHCEICDKFIDSIDTVLSDVRHSKTDRRSKPVSSDDEHPYKGPERRSGKDRRI